jgi:hypothetical protein
MGVRAGSERGFVIGMVALGVVCVAVLTALMAGSLSWGWIIALDGLFVLVVLLQTTRGIYRLRNRQAKRTAEESRTPPYAPGPSS